MPKIKIELERATFERLQKHARPLVDTTDTVITRALEALESAERHLKPRPVQTGRSIDPDDLPNLTHTRVLDASLDGEPIPNPNWNLVVRRLLVAAHARVQDFDELRKKWPGNIVRGSKNDDGYDYLAEIGMSVQASPAKTAGQRVVEAARQFGVEVEIGFMWRQKQAAAFPGESARLKIPARV